MIKIIIYGPTATGKTSLSISLAKILNAEIISADSAQVYKYMNIGTAKIREYEKENINHHLIDILEPNEKFSFYTFKKSVEDILESLKNKGKNVIIVGGTALYIKTLIYGISQTPPVSIEIRDELIKRDNKELYRDLLKIDPEALEKIPMNNKIRLVRALEVFYTSGKKFSSYNKENSIVNEFYNYYLSIDRATLYERIDRRVDRMIDEGLVEEVKNLFIKYGMINVIGYKEIIESFQNKLSIESAVEKIKRHSRNYAKRQITWLNSLKSFKVINIEKEDPLAFILEDLNNKMEE